MKATVELWAKAFAGFGGIGQRSNFKFAAERGRPVSRREFAQPSAAADPHAYRIRAIPLFPLLPLIAVTLAEFWSRASGIP